MSDTNGVPPVRRFRVGTPGAIFAQLTLERERADRAGRLGEFVAAVDHVYARLEVAARDIGEPTHDFPHARIQVRKMVYGVAVVHYGVHHTEPEVFVRSIVYFGPAAD